MCCQYTSKSLGIHNRLVCFSPIAPPLVGVADYRSDADAGSSPEHVFDTMVMELDQRLEKVRGGEGGSHCEGDYCVGGVVGETLHQLLLIEFVVVESSCCGLGLLDSGTGSSQR